jgi:hypothetical protein
MVSMTKAKVLAAAMLFAGAAGFPQASPAPDGGPAPVQGFSVPALVFELSLFLPEGSFFPRGAGRGQGDQGGAREGQGKGGQGPGRFTRDPALFLSAAQVDSLTPIMQALWKNPFPTPSGARALEATIDAVLSQGQKAERDAFRAERAKRLAQAGTAGSGGAGGGQGFFSRLQAMGEQERQAFLSNLPPDARQRILQRLKEGGGAGRELTPLQQRQRVIEAFLAGLQARKKELAEAKAGT